MNAAAQKAWREGIAPQLSDAGLEALALALRTDDPRLVQGATTMPPPLHCVRDWPIEAGCALAYCAWQSGGLATVGEVENGFAQICYAADEACGISAARYFIEWFDDTPRDEMRQQLLPEVEAVLAARREPALAKGGELCQTA